MDDESQERINRNRHTLVTYTSCSAPFLEFFCQKGIFGFSDVDYLKSFNTDEEKASHFYQLIKTRTNSYAVLIQGLKLTNQYDIVQVLEEGVVPPALQGGIRVEQRLYDDQPGASGSGLAMPKSNIKFEVYDPVSLFTGRTRELEELHRKIWRSDERDESGRSTSTLISQFTAICGLGGIGKTQLARQYILKYSEDFNGNCIWLNAETEEDLSESFLTLSNERLGISTKGANGSEKKIQSIVAEVYRYFQASKCLFVFDNADNVPWLKEYLPRSSSGFSQPSVLLTSRNCVWEKGVETVGLKELSKEEAIELVKKGLGLEDDTNDDDEVIPQLVKRLQCFPLALGQAISFIVNQKEEHEGYSIQAYLAEFEQSQQILLSFQGNELLSDYILTTMTTWTMTVNKIGQDLRLGKDAIKIFHSMAYLSPEKIFTDLFSPFSKNYKAAIQLLVKYSMIRREDQKTILSIHRLVQEVTRMNLAAQNMEKRTLQSLLDLITNLGKDLELDSVEQVGTIWTHASSRHRALVIEYSRMPLRMVKYLSVELRDEELIDFGPKAVAVLKEIGETENHILDIEEYIVISLVRLERSEEAFSKSQSVAGRRMALLGKYHSSTLRSMYYLANMYLSKDPEHAYQVHQKIHERESERLPKGDAELLLNCRFKMSQALQKLEKFSDALNILKEVDGWLKAAPERKWNALAYQVKAAMLECLAELKDFDGALKIMEDDEDGAAEMDNLNSKFEHLTAIHFRRASATVFVKMRLYAKALEKHEQAYEHSGKIFGFNYLETLECKFQVGADLCCMGKDEEAIKIFEDALLALQADFPKSSYIIHTKVMLGCSLYHTRTDLGRALKLFSAAEADIEKLGNSAIPVKNLSEVINKYKQFVLDANSQT